MISGPKVLALVVIAAVFNCLLIIVLTLDNDKAFVRYCCQHDDSCIDDEIRISGVFDVAFKIIKGKPCKSMYIEDVNFTIKAVSSLKNSFLDFNNKPGIFTRTGFSQFLTVKNAILSNTVSIITEKQHQFLFAQVSRIFG